jgi:hypothetical protein
MGAISLSPLRQSGIIPSRVTQPAWGILSSLYWYPLPPPIGQFDRLDWLAVRNSDIILAETPKPRKQAHNYRSHVSQKDHRRGENWILGALVGSSIYSFPGFMVSFILGLHFGAGGLIWKAPRCATQSSTKYVRKARKRTDPHLPSISFRHIDRDPNHHSQIVNGRRTDTETTPCLVTYEPRRIPRYGSR